MASASNETVSWSSRSGLVFVSELDVPLDGYWHVRLSQRTFISGARLSNQRPLAQHQPKRHLPMEPLPTPERRALHSPAKHPPSPNRCGQQLPAPPNPTQPRSLWQACQSHRWTKPSTSKSSAPPAPVRAPRSASYWRARSTAAIGPSSPTPTAGSPNQFLNPPAGGSSFNPFQPRAPKWDCFGRAANPSDY